MAADGDRASPHIGGESPALNPTTCYHIGPLVPEVIPDALISTAGLAEHAARVLVVSRAQWDSNAMSSPRSPNGPDLLSNLCEALAIGQSILWRALNQKRRDSQCLCTGLPLDALSAVQPTPAVSTCRNRHTPL
ncbi:hypothetical protein VTO73DRAFT_3210 [Trametes versicolor]